MEEKRTFVDWVKCPIDFSKKFEYVKFETDSDLYKYDGFYRTYKDGSDRVFILNFRQVFLNEKKELELGHAGNFYPGWYNKAIHFTESEVMEYLIKQKIQNSKPKKKETEGWFKKWINFKN